nr:PREDICTED: protein D3-like [Bemisia tabaci]XP_018905808.1 PREDICTED: protein D3-like [Bemisia tabaci]
MMNHFLMTFPSSLSSHHLCLILVILHQVFSVLSHTEDDVTRFKLKANNMVPFVIPEMPQHTLSVVYLHTTIKSGNKINGYEIIDEPVNVTWPAKAGSYYTLFMIGPDAPVREQPMDKNWLHWLVTNIKGNDVKGGDKIAEYCGSLAGYERGPHWIVYVVYENSSGKETKFDEALIAKGDPYAKRTSFDLVNFTRKYGMRGPVAANFAGLDLRYGQQ